MAEARTSAAGASIADSALPTTIASADITVPSRRCTRSRNTSAMPTIVTPDGAIKPGAAGSTQGPWEIHSIPT